MVLNVYLAGEIHNPWREQLHNQAQELTLPIRLTDPWKTMIDLMPLEKKFLENN